MAKKTLAKTVEKIFFPSNILAIALILAAFLWGKERVFVNDVFAFILSFSAFLFISFLLKRMDVDENLLFFVSITIGLVILGVLGLILPVSRKVIFSAACTLIVTFIILPLRVVWKISLHTLAFTMIITILAILDLRFLILFVFLPLVAWSRLKLKKHSSLQVITGMYVGFLIPIVVYGSYLLMRLIIKLYYLYFA